MSNFYLSVSTAATKKKYQYDTAFEGETIMEVRATYKGTEFFKVHVPEDSVQQMIALAISNLPSVTTAIDAAELTYQREREAEEGASLS